MKKYFLILLISSLILSCNQKEVQLPETSNGAITEVNDISPIYIFYDEESGKAEFNRNNMIGTTNWLVNIDKRLSMGQIVEHLKFLQSKRNKDGMHKNELARNYFSCSNPEIQNLSFIDFTEVTFHDEPIFEFMKSRKDADSLMTQTFINFKNERLIDVGRNFAVEEVSVSEFTEAIKTITSRDTLVDKLYLNINADLTFQDYIWIKTVLIELSDDNQILISNNEFIYN